MELAFQKERFKPPILHVMSEDRPGPTVRSVAQVAMEGWSWLFREC